MARFRVTCVVKHAKYERISSLGCYSPDNVFRSFTEDEVIDRIENHNDSFYVERPTGHVIDLEVVTEKNGNKYVKTIPDGERPDNLLSLPSCTVSSSVKTGVLSSVGTVVAAASHGPSVWW
ncbi:DUF3892 domain-containing protein [Granulicella paludicola]|uniref:DUF3892 domain-containing protein n=1 Tax=Granulicella paludicola TaxID=474951 RepID=UPI0021DFFEE5|nr:DUF3892 domain-containing protein [Granulicella paludicola]